MIPDHVVTLIIVLAVGWFVFRFGAQVCVLLAVIHFWNGAFSDAASALVIAWIIEALKAPILFRSRAIHPYRAPSIHLWLVSDQYSRGKPEPNIWNHPLHDWRT